MQHPLTPCESTNQAVELFASRLDRKLEEMTTSLKRWILVAMLLNVALNAGITAALNVLQDPH